MAEGQNTEMLAREAQLIFSNVEGWTMSEGSLRTWRGTIENIEFEIFLPRLFPEVPPVVRALKKINHPNIDSDGRVSLRITDNWRVEYHCYQVILQLTSLIKRQKSDSGSQFNTHRSNDRQVSRESPRPIFSQSSRRSQLPTTPSSQTTTSQAVTSELAVMKKELERLKDEVTKRDEQLTHFRAKEAIGATGTTTNYQHIKTDDQLADLEAEQIAISELMGNLDERHETGEISTVEYSKLFKKYSRDLFILNKKIEYVQAKQ